MMTYWVIPSLTAVSRACSAYLALISTHMETGLMGLIMPLVRNHSNGRIRKTKRQNRPHNNWA